MRFLILDTDYPEFLNWLYAKHPGLEEKSYREQLQVHRESLYGQAGFYASNLNQLNHEAHDICPNNEPMQKAWAKEHGLTLRPHWRWEFRWRRGIVPWASRPRQNQWLYDILAAQIRHYKPDVVFNQVMNGLDSRFLQEMKRHFRLLVGQHAATQLADTEDWAVYDLVVSSFPPTVDWFRSRQVPAALNRLAFEPRVLSYLMDEERNIPASFIGSFHPIHSTRIQWLEHICSTSQVQVWSPHMSHLPTSSCIHRTYVGPAWGREMYQVLRNSLLTLNHHGNIPPFANNLRLFEATGVGTLLLTDWKENLHEMFEPGKEIIAYRTPEECAELTRYYLDHEDERQAIARAGQARTLREHTFYQRMQSLVEIVSRYL
jgi:spore maturation protein CgeB